MFSDKRFGLSGSLIAAVRGVLVEEKDQGIVDAKKLKGGKTKIDLEPKTDDDTRDYDDKKSMKEGKEHTVPKTEKEKKLASLASPKDKITHKDVLVGRGVLAKEEKDSPESIITDFKDRQAYLGHRKQEADHYKRARRSKDVAQQHHYNMASQHNDSANDILNRYRKTNEEIELDEVKEEDLQEEMTIDKLKKQGFKKVSSSNNGWTHHYAHPDKEHGYKIEYGPQPDTIKSIKKTKSIYEEVDLESFTEEELEEALKKSQPAGEWIKDFVHSKDPKFAGKSKKKRMQMALGAYYAKQRNEEVEIDEATKSATYNALMADPMKNRLERLKQKERSMAPGISAERKNIAIEKDKIQKQLAKKQRNEEVEEIEEREKSQAELIQKWAHHANKAHLAKTSAMIAKADAKKSKNPMDFDIAAGHEHKAKLHTKAQAAAGRRIKEEVELSAEELERIEAIAQSLDEDKPTIVSAPIRGANQDQSGENTKSTSSAYTISDSKKMRKEEVELDEAAGMVKDGYYVPDDEQDEHEHVIMQLRKVVSTHGALPVKHLDGKSTKITPQLAQHALNKHAALKTAAEKQDFEQKLHKSHDSMKSALG